MTLDKRARERLLAHCGELQEDDGGDPRQLFKTDERLNNQSRKSRQLCNQVAQTLGLVLAGEFDDARLQGLEVVSVEPAPNASQLLVTLLTDEPCDSVETQEIMKRLTAVSGRLRWEVAAAITRKRTPRLSFRVLGRGDADPSNQP